MYNDFFQFQEQPFSITPDPRFVYLSRSHQSALEHMVYGVEQRKGFVLITGDIGAGKTTLTRLFLDQIEDHARSALIFNTFLNEIELLRAINREYGLPADGGSREELVRELNEFLLDQMRRDRNVVLILDEAQNLSVPVLEQVRLLSNLETDDRKLIQIILAGQPELARTLDRPDLAQLNQRITVRCRLGPLSLDDTVRYVHHRLTVAGSRGLARFSPGALKRIWKFTDGVPRRINALCDRALLAAFARGTTQVTPDVVRQARAELAGDEYGGQGLNAGVVLSAALLLIGLMLAVYWGYTSTDGLFR